MNNSYNDLDASTHFRRISRFGTVINTEWIVFIQEISGFLTVIYDSGCSYCCGKMISQLLDGTREVFNFQCCAIHCGYLLWSKCVWPMAVSISRIMKIQFSIPSLPSL